MTIQRVARGFSARRRVGSLRQLLAEEAAENTRRVRTCAAPVLQRRATPHSATWCAWLRLQRQLDASTDIQRVYRGFYTRRLLQRGDIAVLRLQAAFRGRSQRKLLRWVPPRAMLVDGRESEPTTCVCAHVIVCRSRNNFTQRIQRSWRNAKRRRRGRDYRDRVRQANAASAIQALFKGKRARSQLDRHRRAALVIQTFYRRWLLRRYGAKVRGQYFRERCVGLCDH